ncbi:hypothetical protein GCM10010166_43310 [Couchioplanes caeruleus subsp. azureus]|nr:hypothetical protein GCM10010166_43310 [Couchioplanes caeruleus subsp. azureus]
MPLDAPVTTANSRPVGVVIRWTSSSSPLGVPADGGANREYPARHRAIGTEGHHRSGGRHDVDRYLRLRPAQGAGGPPGRAPPLHVGSVFVTGLGARRNGIEVIDFDKVDDVPAAVLEP